MHPGSLFVLLDRIKQIQELVCGQERIGNQNLWNLDLRVMLDDEECAGSGLGELGRIGTPRVKAEVLRLGIS